MPRAYSRTAENPALWPMAERIQLGPESPSDRSPSGARNRLPLRWPSTWASSRYPSSGSKQVRLAYPQGCVRSANYNVPGATRRPGGPERVCRNVRMATPVPEYRKPCPRKSRQRRRSRHTHRALAHLRRSGHIGNTDACQTNLKGIGCHFARQFQSSGSCSNKSSASGK